MYTVIVNIFLVFHFKITYNIIHYVDDIQQIFICI